MVVGCTRLALYRTASTTQHRHKRGYCAEHKAYALQATKTIEDRLSWALDETHHAKGWKVPTVKEFAD